MMSQRWHKWNRDVICRLPWMSFVVHSKVSDVIFVSVFNWNNLMFQLWDLRFKLFSGFHSFSSHICGNWSEILKRSMYEGALCLKILLKIPPSWSKLSAARSANRKQEIFPFVQSGSSNFSRAITKIKEKALCLSQSAFSNFALHVVNPLIYYSFACSLVRSFVCWFVRSFVHFFVRSFLRSFVCSFVRSFTYLLIYLFMHLVMQLFS